MEPALKQNKMFESLIKSAEVSVTEIEKRLALAENDLEIERCRVQDL